MIRRPLLYLVNIGLGIAAFAVIRLTELRGRLVEGPPKTGKRTRAPRQKVDHGPN